MDNYALILQAALTATQLLNSLLPVLSSTDREQVLAAVAAANKQADDLYQATKDV